MKPPPLPPKAMGEKKLRNWKGILISITATDIVGPRTSDIIYQKY